MVFRITALITLSVVAIVIVLTRPGLAPAQVQRGAPAAQLPPPMFSPWYGDAISDALELEQTDVLQLERKLRQQADDFPTRLKLMAYHQRADRASHPEDLAKRVRHVLWLIEHAPESEILHSYVAQFSPGQLTPAQYGSAEALWRAALEAAPKNAAIHWNAASFFQPLDPALHLRYLEGTAAADPNHPFALRPLAHLYAVYLLEEGPLRSRAEAGLETSNNVWVLGNAAYMLQSQYNSSVQSGSPNQRAAQLAERYFLRAKALNKDLDRNAILPQLNMQNIAAARRAEEQSRRDWAVRFQEATGRIRRLPVDAFPTLPPAVAGVLRARNCRVPQPWMEGAPRNVIRGEFFGKGQPGWAVLCSVNNSSSLLVFRSDRDTDPEILNSAEDSGYLQGVGGDAIGYSREITTVSRDFIVKHYRAYGGPEPPPIDHHGIDDAFLEKASVTLYFYGGKWLQLQGAD